MSLCLDHALTGAPSVATHSGAHVAGCMAVALSTPPPQHRAPSPLETPSPPASSLKGTEVPSPKSSLPPGQPTPPPSSAVPTPPALKAPSCETLRMLAQTSKTSLLAESTEDTQVIPEPTPPPSKGKGVGHALLASAKMLAAQALHPRAKEASAVHPVSPAVAKATQPPHPKANSAAPSLPALKKYDYQPSQTSQENKADGYWRRGFKCAHACKLKG